MNDRVRAYIAEAASMHGVTSDAVLSKKRGAAYQARLRVMHALEGDNWTPNQIGRALKRDRTTILYGLGRLNK